MLNEDKAEAHLNTLSLEEVCAAREFYYSLATNRRAADDWFMELHRDNVKPLPYSVETLMEQAKERVEFFDRYIKKRTN